MINAKKHPSPVHQDQQASIQQLADLLIQAAPLAEALNAPETPHEDRKQLRELVGAERYFELAVNLEQMCSRRTWEIANAKTDAERQALRPPGWADPISALYQRKRPLDDRSHS